MKKLNYKEKQIFCSQLETVISSGMSVIEGLELISSNESAKVAEFATEIKNKMKETTSLYSAIKDFPYVDDYFIRMIQIAEINGRIDIVLKELAAYYERQDYLQRKIGEAITYPLVLMWMMFAILLVLFVKILPIFNNIMSKMGIAYSGITLVLNNISHVLTIGCIAMLSVFSLLTIAYFVYLKVTDDTTINEKIIGKLTITRRLYKSVGISKLTYALSLFISSGYPLEDAIEYLDNITDDMQLNSKIKNIKNKVKNENISFVDAIAQEDIYKGSAKGILTVGLKAGRQEDTFKKLVDLYEDNIGEETNRFLNVIEPIVIACLSFVVGIALISIMLPLISIMGSLA